MAKGPSTPARLDADRTAKPKTRIVNHPKAGHCVGPGAPLRKPELEDTATKARTPMTLSEKVVRFCDSSRRAKLGPDLKFTQSVIESIGFAIRDSDMGVDIDELEPRMVCFRPDNEPEKVLDMDLLHKEVCKMLLLRAMDEADKVVGAVQQLFDL